MPISLNTAAPEKLDEGGWWHGYIKANFSPHYHCKYYKCGYRHKYSVIHLDVFLNFLMRQATCMYAVLVKLQTHNNDHFTALFSQPKGRVPQHWSRTFEVTTTARNNREQSSTPEDWKRSSSMLWLNFCAISAATPLWRITCNSPNLPMFSVEIDYLLVQFEIMYHLIQRFHIQINKIRLQMEYAIQCHSRRKRGCMKNKLITRINCSTMN